MDLGVDFYEDARPFFEAAGDFLRSRPILHNLVLTLVESRLANWELGRYWVATRDNRVVGAVLQSPLSRPALLVPMELDVVEAIVEAIAGAAIVLPGIHGDPATAACFAGKWAERCKSGAFPTQGMRLYELAELQPIPHVDGELRKAESADRDRIIIWVRQFNAEIHEPQNDFERQVDEWLESRQIWLWDNGEPVSMAVSRKPAQGVIRISGVYTPPEFRGHGFAAACVHGISHHFAESGQRCILYTDLGNPTSNSIYRRIGYRAVAEALHYRFEPA